MFFNKNILFEIININYNLAYKYIYFLFDKGILELFGAYGMYNLINIGYIKNNNFLNISYVIIDIFSPN